MATYRWEIAAGDKAASREIAEQFGIPPFVAHLLLARGIAGPDQISEMLQSDEQPLSDPLSYADMDAAVRRLTAAVDKFERIAVFGDYDVDGVTATALLFSYLESLDANVIYVLPSRDKEGYGLHNNEIDQMHEQEVGLIVTVDNGISAAAEIGYAASLGIDVIVTDHHQPPETLPNAVAVVNPHRADCGGGFKEFAGVGVVFKLICAMEGDSELILDNFADLVALGTVADVVPLVGENRQLVRRGLKSISMGDRLGLNILVGRAGIAGNEISSSDISFKLAPRINAAGRLGEADAAVRLLLSDDAEECHRLADGLCSQNSERMAVEKAILSEAWAVLEAEPGLTMDRVVVLAREGWNSGVVGIVAARLCEALGKPCFVVSIEGDTAHGSGRSVSGFHLCDALTACESLLDNYGGHEKAAGLTIKSDKINEFRIRINQYAAGLGEMPAPVHRIDCALPLATVTMQLWKDSQMLEPSGFCNHQPLLAVMGCEIKAVTPVGGGNHQRVTLHQNGASSTFMKFGISSSLFPFAAGDIVDCAFTLSRNAGFSGDDALTRIIKDIRLSGLDAEAAISGQRAFESVWRGDIGAVSKDEMDKIVPNRASLGIIYHDLIKTGGYGGDIETLFARLAGRGVTFAGLRVALEAMRECGLCSVWSRGSLLTVRMKPANGKADLEETAIFRKLRIEN